MTLKTVLDTGHSWILERLQYHAALEIQVVEGLKSTEMQTIGIGDINLGKGYATEVTEKSRRYLITFEGVLAYQVLDESYNTFNEYERRTKGVLSRYDHSHYLDFVQSRTLIGSVAGNKFGHFALILQDDVIDVIATVEPRIESTAAKANRS